jgi:hypothetical protein
MSQDYSEEKNPRILDGLLSQLDPELTEFPIESRPKTRYYCRLSRYVTERLKKRRNYKTFIASLRPNSYFNEFVEDKPLYFAKFHIPQTHALNKSNFNLTLDHLLTKLSNMKVKYPLFVYSTGNHEASRLNYLHAMEGSVDGRDYLMLVFVNQDEMSQYKRRWPNQILVELPWDSTVDNAPTLTLRAMKSFANSLGTEYYFFVSEYIYCAYRYNTEENAFQPTSLLDVFQTLQTAEGSNIPLLGVRTQELGPVESASTPLNDWVNNACQTVFLVQTDNEVVAAQTESVNIESVISALNEASNEVGLVQQCQQLVVLRGYTRDDPEEDVTKERKKPLPRMTTLDKMQPESYNHNLRVQVVECDTIIDETLSDGKRIRKALAIVGDETASIVMIVNDDQIDRFVPGSTVMLLNAKIVMWNGFMRLELDNWGAVIQDEENPLVAKADRNMSAVEYELMDEESSE